MGGYGAYYSPCTVEGVTYCDDAQSVFSTSDVCHSGSGALMAEVKVCPSVLSTLGAAMGYAGFIELAITIVFVFALQQCGVLRGGPAGHLGQMIKEIVDGKDTAKRSVARSSPDPLGQSCPPSPFASPPGAGARRCRANDKASDRTFFAGMSREGTASSRQLTKQLPS